LESNTNNSLFKQEIGFTLIEVLVALTIMSFLMIGIYTVVENNITTKEMVLSEDREFLQVHTALYRMEQDLSQLYSPLYYSSTKINSNNQNGANNTDYVDFRDSPGAANVFRPSELFPLVNVKAQPIPVVDQPEKNSLRFMSTSNKRFIEGQKQSRFAWVMYTLETDTVSQANTDSPSTTAKSALMRREVNESLYDRNLRVEQIKPQVLLRGVKEILFEFYSRQDRGWKDSIRLLAAEERLTPRAIRVTLTWVDSLENEKTFIRIFRPYWPYFDVVKDETQRQSVGNTNPGGQPPGGAPPPAGGGQ